MYLTSMVLYKIIHNHYLMMNFLYINDIISNVHVDQSLSMIDNKQRRT